MLPLPPAHLRRHRPRWGPNRPPTAGQHLLVFVTNPGGDPRLVAVALAEEMPVKRDDRLQERLADGIGVPPGRRAGQHARAARAPGQHGGRSTGRRPRRPPAPAARTAMDTALHAARARPAPAHPRSPALPPGRGRAGADPAPSCPAPDLGRDGLEVPGRGGGTASCERRGGADPPQARGDLRPARGGVGKTHHVGRRSAMGMGRARA